jgi:MFS family permease
VNYYREAARALRQNPEPVLLYIAIGVGLALANSALDQFVLGPVADRTSDRMLSLQLILIAVGTTAVSAFANTICFARIGREMDKPMWRVTSDADAFHLFYRLWLLLGLLALVYLHVMEQLLPERPDTDTIVIFLCSFLVLASVMYVFGSAVMFYGRPGREEVTQALSTMGHQIGPVIAACVVGLLAGLVLNQAHVATMQIGMGSDGATAAEHAARFAADAVIGAIDALVSCFLFAYAWLVCIYHRDHYEEPGDDFDF